MFLKKSVNENKIFCSKKHLIFRTRGFILRFPIQISELQYFSRCWHKEIHIVAKFSEFSVDGKYFSRRGIGTKSFGYIWHMFKCPPRNGLIVHWVTSLAQVSHDQKSFKQHYSSAFFRGAPFSSITVTSFTRDFLSKDSVIERVRQTLAPRINKNAENQCQ